MKWTRSKDLCRKIGIRKETTLPYNPEQNFLDERKNRTIMEAFKAMLHDKKKPKFYEEKLLTQLPMLKTNIFVVP